MTDVLLAPGEGWLRPITAWRATREERERALATFEAARLLADLRRESDRRGLAMLYRAATGFEPPPPGWLREAALIAAVEAAVIRGELLLLRADVSGRPLGAPTAGRSPHQQVIEAALRGRATVALQGRSYRFAPAEGWPRGGGGVPYVPVRADAARELVAQLEASLATTPAERAAWQALGGALVDPQRGAGVLMLRYVPPAAAGTRPDVALVTPSQLATQVAQPDWIELQLEWDDGSPFDEGFVLTVPGGRTINGPPDPGGVVRVDGLEPGDCRLTFPNLFPEPGATRSPV